MTNTSSVQEETGAAEMWPPDVVPMLRRAITCEYASLTRQGVPITYPVTPYLAAGGATLDVSTGLSYASKADRARRNPKVAVLFSDPVGAGLVDPPFVLVYGQAAVRDADLQANTDRYVRESMARFPQTYAKQPTFLLRRLTWYFARIWIEVTPIRVLWWPAGDTSRLPQEWRAPERPLPASDPPPAGKALGKWLEGATDWRPQASFALKQLGAPVVTVVDGDGYPVPFRTSGAHAAPGGFRLDIPDGAPATVAGPACLTFHAHSESFSGQENVAFVGAASTDETGTTFHVNRAIGNWSLSTRRGQLWQSIEFLMKGRRLRPRLRDEAARRGQPVPTIRLPGEH